MKKEPCPACKDYVDEPRTDKELMKCDISRCVHCGRRIVTPLRAPVRRP